MADTNNQEIDRLRDIIKDICREANTVRPVPDSEDRLREFIFTKAKEALKGGE